MQLNIIVTKGIVPLWYVAAPELPQSPDNLSYSEGTPVVRNKGGEPTTNVPSIYVK